VAHKSGFEFLSYFSCTQQVLWYEDQTVQIWKLFTGKLSRYQFSNILKCNCMSTIGHIIPIVVQDDLHNLTWFLSYLAKFWMLRFAYFKSKTIESAFCAARAYSSLCAGAWIRSGLSSGQSCERSWRRETRAADSEDRERSKRSLSYCSSSDWTDRVRWI